MGVALALAIGVVVLAAGGGEEPSRRISAGGDKSGNPTAAAPAAAPTETPPGREQGRVVGQGSNAEPAGALGVKTFRVVKAEVPQPAGAPPLTVYRLTITGGPFPVRDMPAIVYLDGQPLGVGVESEDLSALTLTVRARELLREGARLAVGYSQADGSMSELPERLHLDD